MKNDPISITSQRRGHATSHSSLFGVLVIAVSVVVMIMVCLLSTKFILAAFAKKRPMQPMQALGILVAPDNRPLTHLPAPALELDDGHADFIALRARQNEKLNTYGWVDRTNGIIRVPIEQAMNLIGSRGLLVVADSNHLKSQLAPEKAVP
jgi:hypothetical protein